MKRVLCIIFNFCAGDPCQAGERWCPAGCGGQGFLRHNLADEQTNLHGKPDHRGPGGRLLGGRSYYRGGEEGVQHARRLHRPRSLVYFR
mgnify:FL=1